MPEIVGRWGVSQAPESLPPEDAAAIKSFIEDEDRDVEKYRAASTTLKSPEARALAARLSGEEAVHRDLWKKML